MADAASPIDKRDRSNEIKGVTLAITIFGTLFVLARLWTRLWTLKSPGWDDFFIALALASGLAGQGCTSAGIAQGLGRSRFVDNTVNIAAALKFSQFAILTNGIAMCTLKVSIGVSLLRLQLSKRFNIVIWISIVISLLVNLTVFPGTFAACRPIARVWDRNIPGHCWPSITNTAFSYTQTMGNILTDLIFTFGPIVYLSKVKVSKHNKWALRGVFLIGLTATACAIAKATELPIIGNSTDPTYDTVDLTIWVKAELNAGLMAASIPPLKKTFENVLASWFGVVMQYSTSGRTPAHTRTPSGYSHGYGPGTFRSSRIGVARGRKLNDIDTDVTESYVMNDMTKRESQEARRSSITEDQRHILQETSDQGAEESKDNSITKTMEYSVSTETMREQK